MNFMSESTIKNKREDLENLIDEWMAAMDRFIPDAGIDELRNLFEKETFENRLRGFGFKVDWQHTGPAEDYQSLGNKILSNWVYLKYLTPWLADDFDPEEIKADLKKMREIG